MKYLLLCPCSDGGEANEARREFVSVVSAHHTCYNRNTSPCVFSAMKEHRSGLGANHRGTRPLAVGSMWFCSLNDDITLSDEATTRPLIFRVWLRLQQQPLGTSGMTESGGEERKKNICPDAFSLTLSRHHPSSQINCTQCRLAVEANNGNKNKTRGRLFFFSPLPTATIFCEKE